MIRFPGADADTYPARPHRSLRPSLPSRQRWEQKERRAPQAAELSQRFLDGHQSDEIVHQVLDRRRGIPALRLAQMLIALSQLFGSGAPCQTSTVPWIGSMDIGAGRVHVLVSSMWRPS